MITPSLIASENAKAARAKKGKVADLGFKPNAVVRVE